MHNFSNLFLIKNSTCFGQVYCPSSEVSTLYTQQQVLVFVMPVILTVCQQTVNITGMTNTYCCVYTVETSDDGQQTCPKHVQFFIKNKFEKQCISLASIIRIYHDERSSECQIHNFIITNIVQTDLKLHNRYRNVYKDFNDIF